MASSLNLLMIYIAIEMVSIPSYMLAGFNYHEDKSSNEASMKYVLWLFRFRINAIWDELAIWPSRKSLLK